MFHSGTQRLIAFWSALPHDGGAPLRAALLPERLGALLPHAFLAERTEAGPVFRLAGDAVERLHGQMLSDEPWLPLWRADSRPLVGAAAIQASREARPVVTIAGPGADAASFEITLVPLRDPGGAADRLLGLYQPLDRAAELLKDAGPFSARVSVGVGEPRRPLLRMAAVDGRRVA